MLARGGRGQGAGAGGAVVRGVEEARGREAAGALRALPPPRRKAAKAKYQETLGYLENHKHKMDYPEYLRQGWYIGSGPVESACKTVVGQRLKLAGMHWGEEGTDHVCHLRALFKSDKGQWEAFSAPPDEQRFNFLPTKLTLTRDQSAFGRQPMNDLILRFAGGVVEGEGRDSSAASLSTGATTTAATS